MSEDFFATDFHGFTRIRQVPCSGTALKGRGFQSRRQVVQNQPRALGPEAIPTQMIALATAPSHRSGSAWNERHPTCI
jgi:hypothetical protein